MVNGKKNAIITDINETSYEDNTFWVSYDIGDNFGYEIISGDKLNEYKIGNTISVDTKPNVNVCSDFLEGIIDECRGSENEMWFVEFDEIEEDEVFKIQDEVIELDKKYKNLELANYITFGEDAAITVYGGVCTRFIF